MRRSSRLHAGKSPSMGRFPLSPMGRLNIDALAVRGVDKIDAAPVAWIGERDNQAVIIPSGVITEMGSHSCTSDRVSLISSAPFRATDANLPAIRRKLLIFIKVQWARSVLCGARRRGFVCARFREDGAPILQPLPGGGICLATERAVEDGSAEIEAWEGRKQGESMQQERPDVVSRRSANVQRSCLVRLFRTRERW